MRTITITLPGYIAEELEADAHTSGRNLADFAGGKFALAYNTAPVLRPVGDAPNTKWIDGNSVQIAPEAPSASVHDARKRNEPLLALLRQWTEEGANATPEQQTAADAEVEELKEALNAEREKAGMRKLFPSQSLLVPAR